MMDGSKVMLGEASAITPAEMPCARASFLNCSSQRSKLPVFRQRAGPVEPSAPTGAGVGGAAGTGVAESAPASNARPSVTFVRIESSFFGNCGRDCPTGRYGQARTPASVNGAVCVEIVALWTAGLDARGTCSGQDAACMFSSSAQASWVSRRLAQPLEQGTLSLSPKP